MTYRDMKTREERDKYNYLKYFYGIELTKATMTQCDTIYQAAEQICDWYMGDFKNDDEYRNAYDWGQPYESRGYDFRVINEKHYFRIL